MNVHSGRRGNRSAPDSRDRPAPARTRIPHPKRNSKPRTSGGAYFAGVPPDGNGVTEESPARRQPQAPDGAEHDGFDHVGTFVPQDAEEERCQRQP